MYLVHDERISGKYVSVLEPAARDSGRDHDHVPARRLRCRLTLAVHDPDFQSVRAENRLRDRANRECLTSPCAGDDPKTLSGGGEIADLRPMLFLESRRDSQAEG